MQETGTYREVKAGDASVWQLSTFTRVLTDVDYAGEPPGEDEGTGTSTAPGDAWNDHALLLVFGAGIGIAGVTVLAILLIRRHAKQTVVQAFTREEPDNPTSKARARRDGRRDMR